jgi:hypothetical protein
MPTIALKATRVPAESGDHRLRPSIGPLFHGNGDIDYLCGSCSFVIASAIGPTQRVPFDSTICPACGATNEFPDSLRA